MEETLEPTVVENMPHIKVDDEATVMAMTVTNATLMAARNGITNSNIRWKAELAREGEADQIAKEKITKELRQIILEHTVCTPYTESSEGRYYFRSNALYDSAKDIDRKNFLLLW